MDYDYPHCWSDRWSSHGYHSQHPQLLIEWKCGVIWNEGYTACTYFHHIFMACFFGFDRIVLGHDILTTGACYQ
jgi:hypothetical protein